ncbi:MAG: hypothetical protein HZB79_12445 [Deltaproteobacteria bacterium]|nr:hypothetical protein [Deltaproteobacteria bacterium]
MTDKIRELITAFFISMMFLAHSQLVFAEAGIQINSTAEGSDGSFLSKTTVKYIITDPAGRRLGKDPRNNQKYNEFSGGYGTTAIDDQYSVEAIFPPINGTYTIEVIGSSLMMFSLDISIYREIAGEGLPSFEIRGVTDKGITSKFQMTYSSDPNITPKVEKVVTISDAKNDVNIAYNLGLITNAGIEQSLIAKLNAAEKAINKGKKQTAENQLNAFINEVNAQKDKHIKENAVKILIEDAEYLINHL